MLPSSDEYWLSVATGTRTIPLEFQRLIAAWELIVRWHRRELPGDETDRTLLGHLETALPALGLDHDVEWLTAAQRLTRWEILRKSGDVETGETVHVVSTIDWKTIVRALYTVRCNIIKGGKDPGNPTELEFAAHAADATRVIALRLLALATP